MFKKKRYKKIALMALGLSMVFGSLAWGGGEVSTKKIDASFGKIKFTYEGKDLTRDIEAKYGTPAFTSDGRAYAPVRSLSDLLGAKIDYDSKNHRVNISASKASRDWQDLEEKNKEIRKLKRKINFLKGIENESSKKTLEKLEEKLNQSYGKYKNIDLDVKLEEDIEGVFMDLNLDLSSTNKRNSWIKIKYKDKDKLIKDLVSQVRLKFPEYKIRGKIYDPSTKRNLYDFEENPEKKIQIENKDYLDEGYFYDEYYDYSDNSEEVAKQVKKQFKSKGILDAKLINLEYISKTASLKVEFSNKYEDKWEELGKYDKEDILEEILKEIKVDNEHLEEIYGDIYMGLRRVKTYKK